MNSTPKRAGRKPKSFKTAENKTIDGLMRQPDGRWRIIATGQRYTEPDEKLAIAKFYRLIGKADHTNQGSLTLHCGFEDWPEFDPKTSAMLVEVDLEKRWAEIGIPEAVIWAKVRRELLDRPQYVASAVGIEQLGYLTNLPKPEKLPSLDALETIWKDHATCTKKQITKVLKAWKDFRATTKIQSITDISPEIVVQFRDQLHARTISQKQQQHLCGGVRRVLSFAKTRAIAVDAISKALNYLSILSSAESATSIDPHPISPEDFQCLLKVANTEDTALCLLCLNGAFYMQDTIRLRWSDISNGCIVTRRLKTGSCIRVCVLWQRTIDALEKLKAARKCNCEYIFLNYAGKPLGISGAHHRFNALRDAANIPHVCSSHFRDGSYTAAVEANVTEDLCRIYIGHRSGMGDHYCSRRPHAVKPCTDAVYAKYFMSRSDPTIAVIAR